MKLPNPDKATIPSGKLEGYALNQEHSEGRHKAVVFRAVLGIVAKLFLDLLLAMFFRFRRSVLWNF